MPNINDIKIRNAYIAYQSFKETDWRPYGEWAEVKNINTNIAVELLDQTIVSKNYCGNGMWLN